MKLFRAAVLFLTVLFILGIGVPALAATGISEVCTADSKTGSKICLLLSDNTKLVSAKWSGPIVDGKAEGHGLLNYVFTGKDGKEITAQADVEMKDGRWQDGKIAIKWSNGASFDGYNKDGRYDGKGIYKYVNGDSYDGYWVAGLWEGHGLLKCADGSSYDGNWVAGKAEGYGVTRSSTGALFYAGEWQGGHKVSSITTTWQAREAVIKGLQNFVSSPNFEPISSKIKIDSKTIEVNAIGKGTVGSRIFSIPLKCINSSFWIDKGVILQYSAHATCYADQDYLWYHLQWRTHEEVQTFIDALNYLRSDALGERNGSQEAAWLDFQQKAAAWRALSIKPPIPEEVRAHWLLAENALREKNLDRAFLEYEKGLAAYPVWPEGHFNAATLCAQLEYYSDAVRHMKSYLELVPDASDSRSARDQIIIWQSKL